MKLNLVKFFQIFFLSLAVIIFSNHAAWTLNPAESSSSRVSSVSESDSALVAQAFGARRYQELIKADEFYDQGNLQQAAQIQRQAKSEFTEAEPISPIESPDNLEPAAAVYWRQANEGMEQDLESKIFAPLGLLTENYPDFVPGHLLLVEALQDYERNEEAIDAIERASMLFPENTEVLDQRIEMLAEQEEYLRAAMAARQFTISYPDHPQASQYRQVAATQQENYQSFIKEELQGLSIGSAIVGALTNSKDTVDTAAMLQEGEVVAGNQLSQQFNDKFSLVNDEQQVTYVNEVGQELAKFMGRDEFEYEFFIMDSEAPQALALPGGKIYVTSGLLSVMASEAELAGVLGHELAHTVLSHNFQKMASENVMGSASKVIPLGNLFEKLGNSDYSRRNEQEADILATQVIAQTDYSADGLHSVIQVFDQAFQNDSSQWFASHPAPKTRMGYIENLITRSGYERYGFEGVKKYAEVFGKNY